MSSAVSNPPAPGGAATPRRRLNARQAETVERVFAAALEELRAVGFDALTVRSVAARANVAPATAYTYFSSKNHLVAELFWRRLHDRPRLESAKATPLARVSAVFDDLADFLASEPELAAAVTTALLGPEPDVMHLQALVGVEINSRIVQALGEDVPTEVVDALSLAWAGAMLQAGMGHAKFANLGTRLGSVARLLLEQPA